MIDEDKNCTNCYYQRGGKRIHQKIRGDGRRMKIVEITGTKIKFDNGNTITYDHIQHCCEYNYADFLYLSEESELMDYDFEPPLYFERVDGAGFRFGNRDKRMFFVPCYSVQNGYYSDEVCIYYNGHEVIHDLQCDGSKMY